MITSTARTIGLGALALALASCAGLGGGGDPAAYARLTEQDVELAGRSLQETLEAGRDGETTTWRNYVSGNAGTITPTRTYLSEGGYFCREYREELMVAGGGGEGGEPSSFTHSACRNEAGRWVWI